MDTKTGLRFGLLCNGPVLEKWQADAIAMLVEAGIQLDLIVLNHAPAIRRTLPTRLKSYPYGQLFFRLWDRFLFRPAAKAPQDISGLYPEAKIINCTPIPKGVSNYFKEKDIAQIKACKLDFLLRFGFNIIRGDILEAARFGVWSFHHDDEEEIRGGPPGFWEVYKGLDVNAVMLQRLTDSLDKGIVLKKVYFRTIRHAYKAHLDQLYTESSRLPLQCCRQILSGSLKMEPSASKAKIYRPPNNMQMLRFAVSMPFRRLLFHLKYLFRQEDWHIGLAEMGANAFLNDSQQALSSVRWLPRPYKNLYHADPFLVQYQGDILAFFETFNYQTGKGVISMAKLSEDFTQTYTVLKAAQHFAFPFVFVWDGKLYCLPECYESGELRLYAWNDQKAVFDYDQTLLHNVAAVDPVLFEYDGRWWLFFTQKHLPSVHVYAYYASQPPGPFIAHENNPVKTDIRSSRPAGKVFYHYGKCVRPAQDCASDYGVAVVLNEIKTLNPQQFEETPFHRIEPLRSSPYPKGLHSFNALDQITIIDGKRFTFTLKGFWHQLRNKLNGK